MTLINLSSENEEKFRETIHEVLITYNIVVGQNDGAKTTKKKHSQGTFKNRLCIVIDGSTLVWVMKDPYTMKAFFELGVLASSVICCRVSPK